MTTSPPKANPVFFYIVAVIAALVAVGLGVKAVLTAPVVIAIIAAIIVFTLVHRIGLSTLESDARLELEWAESYIKNIEESLGVAKRQIAAATTPTKDAPTPPASADASKPA